jgi:formylglycine-generating enzyme required for sulfatase activity
MTPAYAAPEFFYGQATRWSDQYSLAVTYCQLRGGQLPFRGNLFQLMQGHTQNPPDLTMLPERERPAVTRALAKKPAERWASCRTLVEALAMAQGLEGQQLESAWSQQGGDQETGGKVYISRRKPCPGEVVTNSLGMKFAWCPPGTFLMGSPPDEEERGDDEIQHQVSLSKGFYLGVYPVTQAQWRMVTGSDPSHFKGDERPVEMVSWSDCQQFCAELGKRDGGRYRLPTEAEWEYACRAGTTSAFYFGGTISTDQANYDGSRVYGRGKKGVYRQETTPVGKFPASAWGLFDMHGNVFEWCADWYAPYLPGAVTDPLGSNSGHARVLRGGSWRGRPDWCRAARRGWDAPTSRYANFGCRVILCRD